MPTNHDATKNDGPVIAVIIVDHGSKRGEANAMLEQFAEQFRRQSAYTIVEPAHMELAEPSIAAAFDRCVAQGARRIVIAPYFLGPGRHWDLDIPRLAAAAASKHAGVTFTVAQPIGLHPLMHDVIAARIEESLQKDGDRDRA